MTVFVDTSALLALVNPNDDHHARAVTTFAACGDGEALVTTNYVVAETFALVQRRFGMATVATLRHDVLSALDIGWIDAVTHDTALDALELHGPRISFVDHTSFGYMRRAGVPTAFAFDDDFRSAGFELRPVAGS